MNFLCYEPDLPHLKGCPTSFLQQLPFPSSLQTHWTNDTGEGTRKGSWEGYKVFLSSASPEPAGLSQTFYLQTHSV